MIISKSVFPPVVTIFGRGGTMVIRIIAAWDAETFDMLFGWAQIGARFEVRTSLVYGRDGFVTIEKDEMQ